jgi:hypothetical protein
MQKQHEKLVSLSNELVQRELIIAQGTITGAQNHSIKVSFNIAETSHLFYSWEAFVCLMTKPLQLSFTRSKLAKRF